MKLLSAFATALVCGSVASMVYGEPRLTNDIDFVLDLDYRHVMHVIRAFPSTLF